MGAPGDDAKERFLDRLDKRATRKLRVKKVAKTVRLSEQTWSLIDTHRERMGKTVSEFMDYAVWTVTRSYRKAARQFREGAGES